MRFAFVAAAFAARQKPGQPPPCVPVSRIDQNIRRIVGENEPRAGCDPQPWSPVAIGVFLERRHMRAHHAGNRVAISNSEGGYSKPDSLLDELLRMRAAAQE